MKVKMEKLTEIDEIMEIPLYFKGNETDEYVELDIESIYEELGHKIEELK